MSSVVRHRVRFPVTSFSFVCVVSKGAGRFKDIPLTFLFLFLPALYSFTPLPPVLFALLSPKLPFIISFFYFRRSSSCSLFCLSFDILCTSVLSFLFLLPLPVSFCCLTFCYPRPAGGWSVGRCLKIVPLNGDKTRVKQRTAELKKKKKGKEGR